MSLTRPIPEAALPVVEAMRRYKFANGRFDLGSLLALADWMTEQTDTLAMMDAVWPRTTT